MVSTTRRCFIITKASDTENRRYTSYNSVYQKVDQGATYESGCYEAENGADEVIAAHSDVEEKTAEKNNWSALAATREQFDMKQTSSAAAKPVEPQQKPVEQQANSSTSNGEQYDSKERAAAE